MVFYMAADHRMSKGVVQQEISGQIQSARGHLIYFDRFILPGVHWKPHVLEYGDMNEGNGKYAT